MAQPATNPKIEELRFRLKSDPKSRLFYPLAEELRKISQFSEAEQVLRAGLSNHPSYLSAWVSLGRVLRDQHKDHDAVEALTKALQLDPGNVVAARLLADAYLALGDKVEAIKKYKLVYALYPGDQELEGTIARLESELSAPPIIPEPEENLIVEKPISTPPPPPPQFSGEPESDRVFEETASSILKKQRFDLATGDAEPMSAAHEESPFEDVGSAGGYGTDAFSIEQPEGMHAARSPLTAELPSPLPEPLPVETAATPQSEPTMGADEADVFAPAAAPEPPAAPGEIAPGFVTPEYAVTSSLSPLDEADFAKTIRMADLFASEGSIDEARNIYEDLLARDPNNAAIRAKLDALAPPAKEPEADSASREKVSKLEGWLARVKRGEVGRV